MFSTDGEVGAPLQTKWLAMICSYQ